MATTNKWSKQFWIDLAERVGATFLGALLTAFTLTETTPLDWSDVNAVWIALGLPVLFALVKGLLANLSSPGSGASLVPPPAGPEVVDERGATDILYAAGVVLVLLAVILLVTTLLKVFVVSWVVLIVLAVFGFFLLFWRGSGARLR